LGIAGGGTDVSPYSDIHGGAVLNATINLYAYSFITTSLSGNLVHFIADDIQKESIVDISKPINMEGELLLHRAVYKRVMDDFNSGEYIPLTVMTKCDAPPGSGLGSSSTLVVAMLEGYRQLLSLPLGEYDLAHLAYEIERIDCGLSGGKQDQYAASFGGFNFIEFAANDKVIVNPLRIRRHIISELEASIILFFTGTSRDSASIIIDQIKTVGNDNSKALEGMHAIKRSAYLIKELLFKNDVRGIASEFNRAWNAKKSTSRYISTPLIDNIENSVLKAGATSVKVSGAGGGGFMIIFVEPERKCNVTRSLEKFDGHIQEFNFTTEGVFSWTL
jgi:D-glycero-alpha-D-manno-heptose-7-phosphate kinase